MTREFKLTDIGLDYANKKLQELSKKAVKLGLQPIRLQVIGVEEVTDEDGFIRELFTVTCDYNQAIIIADWQMIARVEGTANNKSVFKKVPGTDDIKIPADYIYTDVYRCDHCNIAHQRNHVFLLQHVTTKEFKQVGGNCLRNYLGHRSPNAILAYIEEIQDWLSGCEQEEKNNSRQRSNKTYFNLLNYLCHVCAVVRKTKKYISATKAREWECGSTANDAASNLINYKNDALRIVSIIEEDVIKAEKVIEWAKGYYDLSSDYNTSMSHIFESNLLDPKHVGFAASAFGTYRRLFEDIPAATKQEIKKEYLWNINDTVSFQGKVIKVNETETRFGVMCITTFLVDNHYVVAFLTRKLKEGETYSFVDCTVTEHKEYNDRFQTIVKINFRNKQNKKESEK